MFVRWNLTSLGLAITIAGCAPQPASPSKSASPPPTAEATPAKTEVSEKATDAEKPKPPADEDIDLTVTPIDAEGLQAVVDQHAGKLVLVDCWATWCVPCVKAFPHTVELSKQHPDELAVISLSFDDPVDGKAPAKVKKFLQSKDAPFPHYISTLDLAADGATAFEIPDGSLPHFKLYGRDGKLIQSFSVEEDAPEDAPELHETVAAAVADALKAE